jgi:peptidyl-tRNA hydrolase
MADKVFLVTRADLSDAQQAVQAAHALQEFNILWPAEARDWHTKSNTLAFLVVADEAALGVLLKKARRRDIPAAPFHEPDRNNEMTAIALGPAARGICSGLSLALRDRRRETRRLDSNPAGEGSSPSGPTIICP